MKLKPGKPPKRLVSSAELAASLRCGYCGEKGHKANDCPNKKPGGILAPK